VAQLRRRRGEFEALGARIVVISFGPAPRAPAWLEETQSPFPLLIDARRDAYKAYGMRHSLRGSWNLKTLRRYRELQREGRSLRGIQGDSLQLGGDVIVDADGFVRLLAPSRTPIDRPSVESLLAAFGRLHVEADAGHAPGSRPAQK
jgi:alkyl hydroperoxide reductase subunit AhpC